MRICSRAFMTFFCQICRNAREHYFGEHLWNSAPTQLNHFISLLLHPITNQSLYPFSQTHTETNDDVSEHILQHGNKPGSRPDALELNAHQLPQLHQPTAQQLPLRHTPEMGN